jgi:adenylate cyclase
MEPKGFQRKLTAILSADVAGYSRLMQDDEAVTVRTLEAYKRIISDLVTQHRGRVVDSPGDNLLAEFASVVDAVQCAVAVQKELQARNAELPENRKMLFRIGVNLGDVIEEGERIYGDGVNIAARLESLADPGGICVSKTAFDQIETKLPFGYEFLGEQPVKNTAKPVGTYRVLMEPRVTVARPKANAPKVPLWRHKTVLASAMVVLVAIICVGVWNFYLHTPTIEPASKEKMAFTLPEKPSIAVLPFKNLSGEADQEFLADGITESIIGAISRVSELFVIASNSVFTYKGKPLKVQTVGEELGVHNILEGTVQKAGNHLRVNVQLIDATTGRHLWSEKYDREVRDLFSVQDDISKQILTALRVSLVEGEQERVWARGTNNIEAYFKFLKAYDTFKSFNKRNMILTRGICEEGIGIDPSYEQLYSLMGVSHLIDVWFSWGESPQLSIEKSEAALRKGISLNPQSDFAYANLGHLYLMQERHDEAVVAGEKSVALNPNGDFNMTLLGITFNYVRRYEEAITLFKEAQRRNPYCPAWYIHNMGNSYRGLGRWNEAIAECQRALARKPDHFPALTNLAHIYGAAGRLEEGRGVVKEILRINPEYCIEKTSLPYKYKADAEAIKEDMRKVGIPDKPFSSQP